MPLSCMTPAPAGATHVSRVAGRGRTDVAPGRFPPRELLFCPRIIDGYRSQSRPAVHGPASTRGNARTRRGRGGTHSARVVIRTRVGPIRSSMVTGQPQPPKQASAQ